MINGFFDTEFRINRLAELNSTLPKLLQYIDWQIFRPIIEEGRQTEKPLGGRPSFDAIFMFKILILQQLYDLSDEATEFQVTDSLSFMKFLGLSFSDKVPDAKTIWLFREKLTKENKIERLFKVFYEHLETSGIIVKKGSIIDARIIQKPIQHNSKEENKVIKEQSKAPEDWSKNKRQQKDVDAKWTRKGFKSFYGYKNHIEVDIDSKLIISYLVTPANVHDSRAFLDLLSEEHKGKEIYADKAYYSEKIEKLLKKKGVISQIHNQVKPSNPNKQQIDIENNIKSKTRCRVEHIFGSMVTSMKDGLIRAIGIERVKAIIGIKNLIYNMLRYSFLYPKFC